MAEAWRTTPDLLPSRRERASWCGEWLGVSMFFNGLDADHYREHLEGVGFSLTHDEIRTIREPEGDASFLWIMAEKSAPAP